MTYVVCEPCVNCRYTDCVVVCPVEAFHLDDTAVWINPETCIDCDACRQIAPTVFRDHGEQSSVFHQPETEDEVKRALMSIVACPTSSIGTTRKYASLEGIPSG